MTGQDSNQYRDSPGMIKPLGSSRNDLPLHNITSVYQIWLSGSPKGVQHAQL